MRPHPGAQLSFTDHDGYRFQAILTDQPDPDIAVLECQHRQRARVEDRIRDDKDTGLQKSPFREFALNQVWLELVMLAHNLIIWTQALLLSSELAKAEPRRLRYRLFHVAGRLAFQDDKRSSTSRTPGHSMGQRTARRVPQAQYARANYRLTGQATDHSTSNTPEPSAPIDAAPNRPTNTVSRLGEPPHGPATRGASCDSQTTHQHSHPRRYSTIRALTGGLSLASSRLWMGAMRRR